MTHVADSQARGRHLIPSIDSCDAFQRPKMPFDLIIGSIATSFSWWSGVCQRWWSNLSLVGLSFFSFFFSLP